MAKKTQARKQKTSGKKNKQYDKSNRTRCSPSDVFALLIIYLHETHFGKDSEDEKVQPPWVSYWSGETLRKRMRVDKTDSTGLLRQANQRKDNTNKKKNK
ncbi:hypothetical protein PIB30_001023 [Stylosanthes scabra]|uniref:Uncharacterized protein n=1 Tax=Stylosanthes scabra TaxID=79078 RepID=A0ABU6T282_9FABA|nr:hypothetical protein [Stylosanthes scabra]